MLHSIGLSEVNLLRRDSRSTKLNLYTSAICSTTVRASRIGTAEDTIESISDPEGFTYGATNCTGIHALQVRRPQAL